MSSQVAEGVLIHEIVRIAADLRDWRQPVVAGICTHPHGDHLLGHARD